MTSLHIGLIGTGYMGKAHAIALHAAPRVFDLPATPVCELLAEVDETFAVRKASELGFARATGNWHELVADSRVDVVDICAPNFLHKEMALAAIAAGKHVYLEKPMALNDADAAEMIAAAERAGVKTLVGFNYVRNPATQLAREIITNGEIGEVIHFRGRHNEDYLADPAKPHDWHTFRETAGAGALGDLGSHILHMAEYLTGRAIKRVCGQLQTVITERFLADGSGTRPVENDDHAQALVHFDGGLIGSIETSRIASGRKMGLAYTVTGTKGAITFDQERMSELKLYQQEGPSGRRGFRTLLAGPDHPDYAAFCPAPGHGLGYNDQKIIEIRDLIEGLAGCRPLIPDFRQARRINTLIEAIEHSHREGGWVELGTA
ncbi:putative dehydrogenase [Chromohalobacter marismortui]|uniref:Putative dehydrogenase n=1 Tax=Chromohalobacter marismortui TaxID=42055 RepID=A0A4R7NUX3_9GAMM|nr:MULTISPECIES: Gfo/Idh/MocA family oxidoreductase [Chromohalobacter]MCI0510470.1 Gfo/Idh/MocA family oxidoreductase [Chromohalobacter sp.]MCI0594177.1 Gfo/Idh/MocA family oxidoreductase [Chromohalobacter sp.]TDU24954.1 putative dehydrogenase [Chromohalobacter marismortui]